MYEMSEFKLIKSFCNTANGHPLISGDAYLFITSNSKLSDALALPQTCNHNTSHANESIVPGIEVFQVTV